MASGTIPQDFGALWWNDTKTRVLDDFNIAFSEVRVIIGRWNSSTLNKPTGSTLQGFYIHFATSDNYAIQFAANISFDNKLFIRRKFSGTWGSWKEFTAS